MKRFLDLCHSSGYNTPVNRGHSTPAILTNNAPVNLTKSAPGVCANSAPLFLTHDAPPSDAPNSVILPNILSAIGRQNEREETKNNGHPRTTHSYTSPVQRPTGEPRHRVQPADGKALPRMGPKARLAGRGDAQPGRAAEARNSQLAGENTAPKPIIAGSLS